MSDFSSLFSAMSMTLTTMVHAEHARLIAERDALKAEVDRLRAESESASVASTASSDDKAARIRDRTLDLIFTKCGTGAGGKLTHAWISLQNYYFTNPECFTITSAPHYSPCGIGSEQPHITIAVTMNSKVNPTVKPITNSYHVYFERDSRNMTRYTHVTCEDAARRIMTVVQFSAKY